MKAGQPAAEPPAIRLVFQLERAEHPRLYDELVRFHKGVKRVNRLRVLAYDGLLVQQGQWRLTPHDGADHAGEGRGVEQMSSVTNDLFAPPIDLA